VHGFFGDTWTFDGKSWHATTARGPVPRYLAAMAFDAAHNDYVMFGGQTAAIGPSDETWTFDGRAWKKMTPAHTPPLRSNAALAYDAVHRYVLMYGGINNLGEGNPLNDTWSWDGTDWALHPGEDNVPGYRNGPRMVGTDSGVVLFGGNVSNLESGYFSDLWIWNGDKWSPLSAGPGPAGRAGAALVWDPQRFSLFVFGGTGFNAAAGPGANGSPLGDAWAFNDGRWTRLSDAGPPPLSEPAAVREPSTGRIDVLLGISCPAPIASSWGWDGTSWTQRADPGMSARWGAAVAQGPSGSGLLFGGSNARGC
jgi:hypothetical protein